MCRATGVVSLDIFYVSYLTNVGIAVSDKPIHVAKGTVVLAAGTEKVIVPPINFPKFWARVTYLASKKLTGRVFGIFAIIQFKNVCRELSARLFSSMYIKWVKRIAGVPIASVATS